MSEKQGKLIYALRRTKVSPIRYIGASNNPARRVGEHFRYPHDSKLSKLWHRGSEPTIIMLSSEPSVEWRAAEGSWIKFFLWCGSDLLNKCHNSNDNISATSKALKKSRKKERRG